MDPLLFYLRDHELYYTALHGPRYNEYAIFIDYHEWYLSANMSFYQYLKIILAYRSLLQTLNDHPVVIILPTGYVETWRFFHHFSYGKNNITYWKHYEHCVLRFVQRVIPDVHICPQDFLSYQTRFFRPFHSYIAVFKTPVYKRRIVTQIAPAINRHIMTLIATSSCLMPTVSWRNKVILMMTARA